MAEKVAVSRNQKISGANAIMDQGYATERDIPDMMNANFAREFVLEVQDELELRSLDVSIVLESFNYYMGTGCIIYAPSRISQDEAKEILRKALGYKK
ncbi:hypothetical protein PQ472_01935 [Lacticaseibacillus pabuli]|uniref:Uncharacterized protein n=1 Tax=Lacticaseibacillus pabuli TaxID=3025672 RepID=A0ABY7WS66_9LACO|nr:hypothetical protein [Lacticaseibacillus sp. KACC 23028]WDF83028.1 hypothetical protein PQ472_01935 [Lacticaseibacillus sp. KACC 23028]